MLGGASLIVLAVFGLLSLPAVIQDMRVRVFLQQTTGMTLGLLLALSYPHFIWSFRFAYQQGVSFIRHNTLPLLGYPLLVIALLALSLSTWSYPVANLPLLVGADNMLQHVGIGLYWSQYDGLGQAVLATLLICQIVMAGHHYCMQAFGVALASGEDKGYRLTLPQKQMVRANLYALWAMNLFSGYTFFSMLNSRGFTYHPITFPKGLCLASYILFAITTAAVFISVVMPHWRQKKKPPILAVVPIFSVWLWLQPFWQPYGYQLWVVPLAHGAQYLYFALKVEGNNFGGGEFKSSAAKVIYLIGLTGVIILVGYLGFVYVPLFLDAGRTCSRFTPNFYMIATFVLISTHHYIVDGVVWRRDSRSKKLLYGAAIEQSSKL
jgi:hypothetical protein